MFTDLHRSGKARRVAVKRRRQVPEHCCAAELLTVVRTLVQPVAGANHLRGCLHASSKSGAGWRRRSLREVQRRRGMKTLKISMSTHLKAYLVDPGRSLCASAENALPRQRQFSSGHSQDRAGESELDTALHSRQVAFSPKAPCARQTAAN